MKLRFIVVLLWAWSVPVKSQNACKKNYLNSTEAKLAPQKLAPNLLFCSYEADLFGKGQKAQLTQLGTLGIGNHYNGRGISAHIHCSLTLVNRASWTVPKLRILLVNK